jgi:hypothetical protein
MCLNGLKYWIYIYIYIYIYEFSEANHPFLESILKNIANIAIDLYNGVPIYSKQLKSPIDRISCTTGPGIFTHSILEVINFNKNITYRACRRDFNRYKAICKMVRNRDNPHHYSKHNLFSNTNAKHLNVII